MSQPLRCPSTHEPRQRRRRRGRWGTWTSRWWTSPRGDASRSGTATASSGWPAITSTAATMTLPHTEVDPAVGGQGIGTPLVAGVLDRRPGARADRPPLLLLRPAIHPAASRVHRPRRRPTTGPTSAWRPPTADLRRSGATCLRSAGADVAALVPPRPPALRPPRPAGRDRRRRARRRRRPGVRPRPPALGPGRAPRRQFLLDCLAALEDVDGRRPGRAARATRAASSRRSPREVGGGQRARLRRRRALRTPPRPGGRAGARRRAAGPHRLAVRGHARAG